MIPRVKILRKKEHLPFYAFHFSVGSPIVYMLHKMPLHAYIISLNKQETIHVHAAVSIFQVRRNVMSREIIHETISRRCLRDGLRILVGAADVN